MSSKIFVVLGIVLTISAIGKEIFSLSDKIMLKYSTEHLQVKPCNFSLCILE